MSGSFVNPLPIPASAIIEVPMTPACTMSAITVFLADGRAIDSMVIDATQAQSAKRDETLLKAAAINHNASDRDPLEYDPDLFRFPVANVPAQSVFNFDVGYYQAMRFTAASGNYSACVPTTFHSATVENVDLSSWLEIFADVNTGSRYATWGCTSHPLELAGAAGPPTVSGMPQRFLLQVNALKQLL
jgi:hypothetical protein